MFANEIEDQATGTTTLQVVEQCRTWDTSLQLVEQGWTQAETVAELHVGQVVVVFSHKQLRQGIVISVPGARGKNITVLLTTPTAIEEAKRYNHGVRVTKVVRAAAETYYVPAAPVVCTEVQEAAPIDTEKAVAELDALAAERDAADFVADPAEQDYQRRQTPDSLPSDDELDAKILTYQSNGLATPEQRAEVVRLAADQDVDAGWLDALITNATGAGLTARECASAIVILRNQAVRLDRYHRANGARKLTPKQRRRAHQKRRTDTLRELRTLYMTAA